MRGSRPDRVGLHLATGVDERVILGVRVERISHVEGERIGVEVLLKRGCLPMSGHVPDLDARGSVQLDHNDHRGSCQAHLVRRHESRGGENLSDREITHGSGTTSLAMSNGLAQRDHPSVVVWL